MMNFRFLLPVLVALVLCGCATTPAPHSAATPTPASGTPDVNQSTANPLAIDDPWGGFNRRMYHFNAWFDDVLFLPVIHGYKAVTPGFVRDGVSNFFRNIGEITTFANAVLQLRPKEAATTLGRFVLNSTYGIGGLVDVATNVGIPDHREDFGQTLGRYGVGAGPYLVLPVLGPSDLRDAFGLAVDRFGFSTLDPLSLNGHLWAHVGYLGAYAINTRYTTDFRYYQTGSPFEYILVRFIYLNYRKYQIAH